MEKSTPKAQQGPIVLQCETVGQMTAKNSQRQSQGKVNQKWIVLWIRSQKWMPAVASMAKRRRLLRLARGGPTVTLVAYKPFYPKPCHHPSCWSRGFVPAASPPGRPKLLAHFWRSYGWDWLILPGYQTEPGGFYKWPIIPSWWIYHWNNGKTWKNIFKSKFGGDINRNIIHGREARQWLSPQTVQRSKMTDFLSLTKMPHKKLWKRATMLRMLKLFNPMMAVVTKNMNKLSIF